MCHLPIALQREVLYHLNILEFKEAHKMTDMELKKVKEQYLKLAQKYHPDSGAEADEAVFINVKESFDRIVQLDKESNGQLFISIEKIKVV